MAKLKLTNEEFAELVQDFPALENWTPNGTSDWADLVKIFGAALPQRLMWAIVDHKKASSFPVPKRTASIIDRFK